MKRKRATGKRAVHAHGLIDADLLHAHRSVLPPLPEIGHRGGEKPPEHAAHRDDHRHGLIDADLLHAHHAKQKRQSEKEAIPVERHLLGERLRRFFFRHERPAILAVAGQNPKVAHVERKKDEREKPGPKVVAQQPPPRKPKKEKPPRRRITRRSLEEYLDKAGFEVSADLVRRRVWQALLAAFLIASAYVLIQGAIWGAGALDILVFMAGLWTVGFLGVFLITQGAVYFSLDYVIYRRAREIERYLPDFLQLASSNIAAGMAIDRALWYSIRPSFGVLATEMEKVAKATMAGEGLERSLTRFAESYDSAVLHRSVSILIEGLRAGGEMADLLNKIALNIEEIRIMKQEMAANVTTYAIFITFASVVVAPFLFALATQLLEIIIGITGRLDLSSSGGFFTIAAADPAVIGNFRMFSIAMLIVSTAFSAALVSIIKRGNVIDGIKSIPVYAIASVLIYYVSLGALHGAFGGVLAG